MDITGDELAGVADVFGGLTRAELDRAVEELAFKRGTEADADVVADTVESAIDAYRLVAVEADDAEATDETLLVPGPAAFPSLPEGAEDLPHILDIEERTVDRDRVATAARTRLEADAERAVEAGDAGRAAALVDVSYDLETWGVDVAAVRDRLDDA